MLDNGDGMKLGFDYLAPLEHLGLRAFLPAASSDEETRSRRGCVVLCRDPAVAETLRPSHAEGAPMDAELVTDRCAATFAPSGPGRHERVLDHLRWR
jgi:hypothetical protein